MDGFAIFSNVMYFLLNFFCSFANVTLVGMEPTCGKTGRHGTILLSNPVGSKPIDYNCLVQGVSTPTRSYYLLVL